ncbi:LamG domain-containing protein [Candidatus Poribacteria bacterium]|nr:LamG domain-containing protein [Candidatus Poribacteria bacterium]
MEKSKLRFYLDGDEVANGDDNTKNTISSETPLWFASQAPNDPDFQGKGRCPGAIDELCIYNQVLSKEEIQQNYKVTDNAMAVSVVGKVATYWGSIKVHY